MPSPRFLLIAQPNSYRIAPYIKACTELGIECRIASRGEHSLISEVASGLHIELDDHDAALQAILHDAAHRPYVGVLGSDDSTVELAARAAQALGLPHNPPEAAQATRRKDLARKQLAQAGCPAPAHRLLNLGQNLPEQIRDVRYPCVIKPVHLSASRGVMRCDNEAELLAACERLLPILNESDNVFENSHALLEDYIDGIEVAFEGYLHNGKLHTLAIFDKPEPLTGPCFEETIYVTPSTLDASMQQQIEQRVQQACNAFQLHTGPVHAELRIDEQDAWILEVASRTIGGDCARTLDTGNGQSLEQLTIQLAMGQQPQVNTPKGASGVMMLPIPKAGILKRVEGLLQAQRVPYVEKVEMVIPNGHELIPLPEGNQYPGYIFARAPTPQQVVDALKQAHAELHFEIAPLWKIHAA